MKNSPMKDRRKDQREGQRSDGATPWGESPDLLRWRADLLMDEMMLGAVDVYAGEPNLKPFSAPPSSVPANGQRIQSASERATPTQPTYSNGHAYNNGEHYKSEPAPSESPLKNGHSADPLYGATPVAPPSTASPGVVPSKKDTQMAQARSVTPGQPPAREPKAWVFSA